MTYQPNEQTHRLQESRRTLRNYLKPRPETGPLAKLACYSVALVFIGLPALNFATKAIQSGRASISHHNSQLADAIRQYDEISDPVLAYENRLVNMTPLNRLHEEMRSINKLVQREGWYGAAPQNPFIPKLDLYSPK